MGRRWRRQRRTRREEPRREKREMSPRSRFVVGQSAASVVWSTSSTAAARAQLARCRHFRPDSRNQRISISKDPRTSCPTSCQSHTEPRPRRSAQRIGVCAFSKSRSVGGRVSHGQHDLLHSLNDIGKHGERRLIEQRALWGLW